MIELLNQIFFFKKLYQVTSLQCSFRNIASRQHSRLLDTVKTLARPWLNCVTSEGQEIKPKPHKQRLEIAIITPTEN